MRGWIVAVALMLLFSLDGARAQTLGALTEYCEKLESFWQKNPPKPDKTPIPLDLGSVCYGYMTAIGGLSGLIIGAPSDETADCSKGFGPNCRHALSICFPKGASHRQALAVFLAYARSHAPQWHEEAWHHVLSSHMQAFPCKGE